MSGLDCLAAWDWGIINIYKRDLASFKGTPLDQIGIPTYVDAHVAQDEFEKAYEELHRRKGFTKTGIKLIGWGFGIQLIAQILNGPW